MTALDFRRVLHKSYPWVLLLLLALSFALLTWDNPAFLQAETVENGEHQLQTEQPYSINIPKNLTSVLLLDIDYSHRQNATIIVGPENVDAKHIACIENISVNNPPASGALTSVHVNQPRFCNETRIDLSPYLNEGINQVAFEISSTGAEVSLYIHPQLFGTHLLSTLACLCILAIAAAVFFILARRVGLNAITSAIGTLGFAYYALWLHIRGDLTYTADLPGHILYTRYMVHQWTRPYGYNGHECFHPPVHYFLASLVFRLFNGLGIINPLTAIRAFSLFLYSIFCIYGLKTLNEANEKKQLPYYLGVVLIMFWPVGIDTATNISNDIAIYAVWAPMFYYLVRWHRQRRIADLQITIVLTGLGFLVKSNAWVLLAIMGGVALYALWIKQLSFKQLLRGRSLVSICLLLLGIVANMGKPLYLQLSHGGDAAEKYFGGGHPDVYPFSYFVHFNLTDFVRHPYSTFTNEPGFLNYFLKTMLYSQWLQPGIVVPGLPNTLNVLLLIFLLITIMGTILCAGYTQHFMDKFWPCLVCILISLVSIIGFTLVERYEFCQNFRYILPTIVPLAMLFVSGMETARMLPRWRVFYYFGMIVGTCLPVAAVLFYLSKH